MVMREGKIEGEVRGEGMKENEIVEIEKGVGEKEDE